MTGPDRFTRQDAGFGGRLLTFVLLAWLAAACSHVPLATMVKLRNFDLLKTDPGALRIGVKYPVSIQIPPNGARMRLTVTEKNSGTVQVKEELAFDRVRSAAEKAELSSELQAGWRIDIFRLPQDRIAAFKAFQDRLLAMSETERDRIDGSMNLSVDACIAGENRPDSIVVSTYLKASETGGFVPLVRDADLQALMTAEGLDADAVPLGPCQKRDAGGF